VGQVLTPAHHREAGCLHWPTTPNATWLDQYPGAMAAADGLVVELLLPRDGVATNQMPPLPSPLA
jgi:hypothetical protein